MQKRRSNHNTVLIIHGSAANSMYEVINTEFWFNQNYVLTKLGRREKAGNVKECEILIFHRKEPAISKTQKSIRKIVSKLFKGERDEY